MFYLEGIVWNQWLCLWKRQFIMQAMYYKQTSFYYSCVYSHILSLPATLLLPLLTFYLVHLPLPFLTSLISTIFTYSPPPFLSPYFSRPSHSQSFSPLSSIFFSPVSRLSPPFRLPSSSPLSNTAYRELRRTDNSCVVRRLRLRFPQNMDPPVSGHVSDNTCQYLYEYAGIEAGRIGEWCGVVPRQVIGYVNVSVNWGGRWTIIII